LDILDNNTGDFQHKTKQDSITTEVDTVNASNKCESACSQDADKSGDYALPAKPSTSQSLLIDKSPVTESGRGDEVAADNGLNKPDVQSEKSQ
ncbi:hypothetical protein LSH36_260g03001, partial [Paralvinella palmiformis]